MALNLAWPSGKPPKKNILTSQSVTVMKAKTWLLKTFIYFYLKRDEVLSEIKQLKVASLLCKSFEQKMQIFILEA